MNSFADDRDAALARAAPVPAPGPAASTIAPASVTLFHYAPLLLVLLVVIADAGQRSDPDLWGHVRFGQVALAAGHLVLRDTYSYSAAGHLSLNHEWLTDEVMASAYNALGVFGLKLWKFACVAATIGFMALGIAETGAAASIQLNVMAVASVALMPQMQFRPQLFTFMCLAALLAILARDNFRGAAPIWLAIPLMALWANLHGGFIMGGVALGAYTGVVAMRDFRAGAGFGRAPRLAALTAGATLATLLTPYGFGMWSAILHALRNPVTRIAVTDWQPLTFAMAHQWHTGHLGVIYYLCVIGLAAALAIALAREPRGGDLPLVAIAAIMSAAAFIAMRNMPLAVIACVTPLARHLELIARRRRTAAPPDRSAVNPWIAGVTVIILAAHIGLFSGGIEREMAYPDGAVDFMAKHDLHGNILNDFGWGDYLIWHTAPGSKVFIDGRYDTVYPYAVIDRYIEFRFALPGGTAMLKAYPHDYVLIEPDSPAFALMRRQADWILIYRDGGSALFARAGSPAAAIAPVVAPAASAHVGYFP